MNWPTLEHFVGNTPLVRLQRLPGNTSNVILAKLEGNNPAGSVKDRPALSMIKHAEARGDIKPGDTLIEATSGNTGIALAMVAAMAGYRMILIMPVGREQDLAGVAVEGDQLALLGQLGERARAHHAGHLERPGEDGGVAGPAAGVADEPDHVAAAEQHGRVGGGQIVHHQHRALGGQVAQGGGGLAHQVVHDAVAHLVEVGAALGEERVAGALQLLAQLAEDPLHRPLGVEQLVLHQRPRALHHEGVLHHHAVGVEDEALLALAQALADGGQLIEGQPEGRVEPGELLVDDVRLHAVARHTGPLPVDRVRAADGDA